jgi:hypothetical protein
MLLGDSEIDRVAVDANHDALREIERFDPLDPWRTAN